jgi:hypothetical protein
MLTARQALCPFVARVTADQRPSSTAPETAVFAVFTPEGEPAAAGGDLHPWGPIINRGFPPERGVDETITIITVAAAKILGAQSLVVSRFRGASEFKRRHRTYGCTPTF